MISSVNVIVNGYCVLILLFDEEMQRFAFLPGLRLSHRGYGSFLTFQTTFNHHDCMVLRTYEDKTKDTSTVGSRGDWDSW